MNAKPFASSWPVWVGLLAYTALRLALLPPFPDLVYGFNHDSNYIALVAENLLAGRGYVNDAHWLVFLNPDHLPVAFHNANPLYPTAVAGMMATTGRDPAWSGLALSAIAGSLLFAALFVLARRYVPSVWQQVLLAAAGMFFPPVFTASLNMLPDAQVTALLAWCAACLFGAAVSQEVSQSFWGLARWTALAGVLFGLAWLTRSSAVLALPAVAVYLGQRHGWRLGFGQFGVFVVAAGIVAAPWLIHTAVVWGNPLRSDSSFYLWQDYHAHVAETTIDGYWHLPNQPRGVLEILRSEPRQFLEFQATGVPFLVRNTLAEWAGSYAGAGVLVLLTGLCAWQMWPRSKWPPETVALVVFAATTVAAFIPRARSMEQRYFAPLGVLVATVLVLAALKALAELSWRRPALVLVVLFSAAWWLGFVPARDQWAWSVYPSNSGFYMVMRKAYREVNGDLSGSGPVVVGEFPYQFTYYTGRPALSMPLSDDAYLLTYMERYGSRWIVLTPEERKFFRKQWEEPGGLPPQLRFVGTVDSLLVYERVEGGS